MSGHYRYVGVSKHPQKRYEAVHMHGGETFYQRAWTAELKGKGLLPELHVLEGVSFEERFAAEARWIHHLLCEGHALMNRIYKGGKRPEITLARLERERDS